MKNKREFDLKINYDSETILDLKNKDMVTLDKCFRYIKRKFK